jgi:hypothetical protein
VFALKNKTTGELAKMEDGSPFKYSSRVTAQMAKGLLQTKHEVQYAIVSA